MPPRGDRLPRVLHERVAAIVEGDGRDTPARRASSTRRFDSAAVIASGLSETTCLPLASAADVTSQCR